MKGRLFLNVIITQSATILQLLAGENKTLLVWGNSLLVLDLRLDIVDGIRALYFQGNRLAGQGLDENLHTTTKTENQMQSRLLLNIVVREGTPIFELLSGENKTLLIWGDPLLILDLGFDVVDGIRRLNFKGNGFAGQGLNENLHTTAKTEYKMESRFLLNVVVGESATILELLSSKDQTLLIWGNALLVLDLGLDVVDSVRRLNLQGDRLAGNYGKM